MMILRALLLTACMAGLAMVSAPAHAAGGPPAASSSGPDSGDSRRRNNLTSSESYLPLASLAASVQADYRLRGVMNIEVGLEIEDARKRRAAQVMMPRLRDSYVSALSLYAGVNYRFGDVPDVERITELLQRATDEALGHDEAKVLLGMVIIHAD